MKTCVSVIFIALFLLFQSAAARASNCDDVGSNSVEPVTATTRAPRYYRELSIYASEMLANPQLMSDLKNQRLFFTGVRLTSRLFTTRHLFIGGNLDLKPLIIHSKSVPNGREYTYGGGSGVGLQFAPRLGWRWQPFFDVDGGFVAFPHDVPMANTRRVNMALDFGPGVTEHGASKPCLRWSHGLRLLHLPQLPLHTFHAGDKPEPVGAQG